MAMFSEKRSRKVGKAVILITEKRSFLKIAGALTANQYVRNIKVINKSNKKFLFI